MFTCVTYEFYRKLGRVYFFTNNNFAQTTVFDFFSSNGGDNSSGRGVFSKSVSQVRNFHLLICQSINFA